MEETKPILDDLSADIQQVKEGIGIIVSKMKGWQGQMTNPKEVQMIGEIISNTERQGQALDLLKLVAMMAQLSIQKKKDLL